MSVIGDMRDSMMALINAATGKTSVKWDGDPLAFDAAPPAIGVQWMDGIDSEALEISINGAYEQQEYFVVLIAARDDFTGQTPSYAGDQAFTIMQQISGALNESAITIGGVIDAGRSRPYRNPEWGGKSKQFVVGHAGQALFLMAFSVERVTQ
jgi:hypothetical protein